MNFIDTHTHLFLPDFDMDRNSVIENAINLGVHKMLLPNIDSKTIKPMLELCKAYPNNCFPMIGLHPTSVKEDYKSELQIIEQSLFANKFLAVGEIGIDLYWDKTFFKQQCEAFEFQINIARNQKLPIVIHSRESIHEIISILQQQSNNGKFSGVFHSFSGTMDDALAVVELGFKIGINGVVTFKNSKLQEVVKSIPLEHILLETDSPYLTPVPHRGKRNESSYVIHVAQKIAELKNMTLNEVALTTSETATSLFNIN